MLRPEIGSELSKALVEGRRADARRVARSRRPVAGTRASVRRVLGVRLASIGHRLSRDAVEVG